MGCSQTRMWSDDGLSSIQYMKRKYKESVEGWQIRGWLRQEKVVFHFVRRMGAVETKKCLDFQGWEVFYFRGVQASW